MHNPQQVNLCHVNIKRRVMNNPFEPINARLTNLEALTLEVLQHLRSTRTGPVATTDETPLNVQQAADFLGIAPQTIYQRIKDLPSRKRFGRHYFYPSELRAFLDNGKGGPDA